MWERSPQHVGFPDGSVSRVEFSPWFTRSYDQNETVREQRQPLVRGAHGRECRSGGEARCAPPGAPRQHAC
jgi:hypothetical protein